MRLLVCPAVVGAGKALATKVALEWELARVAQAVALQVAALGEGPRAHAALVWPVGIMVPQARSPFHRAATTVHVAAGKICAAVHQRPRADFVRVAVRDVVGHPLSLPLADSVAT